MPKFAKTSRKHLRKPLPYQKPPSSKNVYQKKKPVKKEEDDNERLIDEIISLNTAAKKTTKSKVETPVADQERGILYVGHLPFGFFEDQLHGFFSQFGDIVNLKVARNRKTGKSKHHAFIEYDSAEVADIVADTMNGYFMFNRILKCHRLPEEKIHENLFKGVDRNLVPSFITAAKRHNAPKDQFDFQKIAKRLSKKDAKVRAKLAELGIDYQFVGYAENAPKKKQHNRFTDDDEDDNESDTIEADDEEVSISAKPNKHQPKIDHDDESDEMEDEDDEEDDDDFSGIDDSEDSAEDDEDDEDDDDDDDDDEDDGDEDEDEEDEEEEPQSKPTQHTKHQQAKPQQSKPQQSKPQQSKPQQSKPQQSKPQQSKPQQSKPQQSKPQQSKPQQSKPQQSKPQPQQVQSPRAKVNQSGKRK